MELGGPADIGVEPNKTYMELCCRDYPVKRVLWVFLQFQKVGDEVSARRHWPWAAVAISRYVFEAKERQGYQDEPNATGVSELLSEIAKSARDLNSALTSLQSIAYRLEDRTSKDRRGHLGWLDTMITQAIAGRISDAIKKDDVAELKDHFLKMEFLRRLVDIELAAKMGSQQVDKDLLKRERGRSSNPALQSFVFDCAKIWRSLTGRKPSASRVHIKPSNDVVAIGASNDRRDPDFVLFLRGLAEIGAAPAPSPKQVAVVLGEIRAP